MLQRLKNLNQISKDLEDTVPPLEPGQTVTFQMLNGVDFLEVDVDPKNDKKIKLYPKEQIPMQSMITDPATKKPVKIGVPKIIEKEEATEFKFFIPGGDNQGLFGGKFDLNGDKIEDREMYMYLMLTDMNGKKPNRNQTVRALFENVDYVENAKTTRRKAGALKDALNLIADMSFGEAKELARSLNWQEYTDEKILFAALESFAIADAAAFNSHFTDPLRMIKSDVKASEEAKIISYDLATAKVLWAKGNVMIAQLDKDPDKNWVELFSSWIQAHENGQKVYQSIKKQLRALSKSLVETE